VAALGGVDDILVLDGRLAIEPDPGLEPEEACNAVEEVAEIL